MDFKLLQKYIVGSASEVEKKQVVEWIDESPEHFREFMAQRKLHDIAIWRSMSSKEMSCSTGSPVWKRVALGLMKVAAVFILGFLGSYYWWNKQEQTESIQSVYVPAGQRAELCLSDGTKVWLNSRSRLTFPASFDKDVRKVELDGEGYFNVESDEKHPFIVQTYKSDVRVLGTEFNVVAYASDSLWETSLLRGKVEVLTPDKDNIVLEPNTKLTLQGNKWVKGHIKDMNYYRWREGLICFDNISLKDMVEKLELYYGVEIVVNNSRILRNHYTGKFRTGDGIEHVLRVLKLNNKFTYTKDDETNIITIN